MKHLFFLLCLTGVLQVTFSTLRPTPSVHFIGKAVSWSTAQKYCRTSYTDLATVEDSSKNSILLQMSQTAASLGITSWPLWIGLFNDINSWRWSFNNLLLTNQILMNWSPGQPDNYQGNESCGEIYSSGYWADANCSILQPFICYDASNSGANRFIGVSSPQLTWSGAQTYCQTFHTDLASALNQTDNDLLAQVASAQGISWFGLFRDTWKWLNTTPAVNVPWYPGKPDNSRANSNCGALRYGQFIDEPCIANHYFFCQTIPPVNRQIVKLRMKSDGNVFDSAVQSAVLEQIMNKLEEHGMAENTTVTWRVQSDGNIFQKENKDEL